ncbi:MAG: tautomerase family protein [Clostridia bacterium]|nr:tautomerase family protein [Clostridia bacterium]
MPYIAIKAYPKDAEIKQKVVDEINEVFLKYWGCPPEAISVSIEEFKPENWEEQVVKKEILPNDDKMMILSGEKRYK